WTLVQDLREGVPLRRQVQAPRRALVPPGPALLPAVFPRRRGIPPGIPLVPPPMPRRLVHATPTHLVQGDEEEDDRDYTEVELDDGLTIVRDPRLFARR
ncbi:MAG TPA: hypothetical protein VFU21_11370, partial [Kofleriaceae bacterium]|nr:hypothetical protein [Kofleriaceae bacterium]